MARQSGIYSVLPCLGGAKACVWRLAQTRVAKAWSLRNVLFCGFFADPGLRSPDFLLVVPTAGGLPCHTARITMRNLIKRLFCRHSDGVTFVRNIYGDEINTTGGKRSEWHCKRCDGLVLMDHLNTDAPQRRQAKAQGMPVAPLRSAVPSPAMDDAWTNPLNPLSPLSPLNPLHSSPAPSPCPAPSGESPVCVGIDYGSSSGSSSGSWDSSSCSSDSGSSSSSDW